MATADRTTAPSNTYVCSVRAEPTAKARSNWKSLSVFSSESLDGQQHKEIAHF